MAEWWEANEVEVHDRSNCYYCQSHLDGTPSFVPYQRHGPAGMIKILALRVCLLCLMHESATVEAQDECRKFTPIELDRCVCGRAMLTAIGRCVTCHRERRMLALQWREIKLTRRILSSIKKEIKRGKAIDGRTPGASV